ncbi:MAG: alpha/beta fold hydrolase [Hyphomonadaceae bacterium]|nr:alpha/beta fold hydrolase [Hyphomonadaceae bacterium]
MMRKPDWNIEGRDWPNRESSRFVEAGGLVWHVQVMGAGPVLVLLHGTGAATHSWRTFAPILAQTYTVVAPDLPGHGFTATPQDSSDFALPKVAHSVSAMLRELGLEPHALIGHSAGAAIAVRMALNGVAAPAGIVGINAALAPFGGPLGPVAPMLARMLFYNPIAIGLFAHRASRPGAIAELMRSTGSSLDPAGLAFYERLFRSTGHLEATLALMAHWDLSALSAALPDLRAPLTLIVGDKDRAVPPESASAVQRKAEQARIITAHGLGHLAHEEQPELVAELVVSAMQHVE